MFTREAVVLRPTRTAIVLLAMCAMVLVGGAGTALARPDCAGNGCGANDGPPAHARANGHSGGDTARAQQAQRTEQARGGPDVRGRERAAQQRAAQGRTDPPGHRRNDAPNSAAAAPAPAVDPPTSAPAPSSEPDGTTSAPEPVTAPEGAPPTTSTEASSGAPAATGDTDTAASAATSEPADEPEPAAEPGPAAEPTEQLVPVPGVAGLLDDALDAVRDVRLPSPGAMLQPFTGRSGPTTSGLAVLLALLGGFLAVQRAVGRGLGHVPMSTTTPWQDQRGPV